VYGYRINTEDLDSQIEATEVTLDDHTLQIETNTELILTNEQEIADLRAELEIYQNLLEERQLQVDAQSDQIDDLEAHIIEVLNDDYNSTLNSIIQGLEEEYQNNLDEVDELH